MIGGQSHIIAEERKRCIEIVRRVCVLDNPAAKGDDYERALDEIGIEIIRQIEGGQ